jgi:hypothetical protein
MAAMLPDAMGSMENNFSKFAKGYPRDAFEQGERDILYDAKIIESLGARRHMGVGGLRVCCGAQCDRRLL